MKKFSTLPRHAAFALAYVVSLHASGQTPGQQSSTSHEMHGMDHAKMGHGAPAAPRKPSQQKQKPSAEPATHKSHGEAPAGQSSTAGQEHAGHAMPEPEKAQSQPPNAAQQGQQSLSQPDAHGSQAAPAATPAPTAGQGHAGHAMPSAQPSTKNPQSAQPPQGHDAHQMEHSGMGHGSPAQQAPRNATAAAGTANAMGPGHSMQMGPMQGGKPPPDARDPNAYNEGARHANFGNHEMNDNAPFGKVLLDKAEFAKGDGERGQNVELEAWYGNDYNKAWLKTEGERRGGTLESARTELLWDRAFATFWSTQLGLRHDSGEGGSRDWLAFGVQGLAPYWFETEATAYWRPGSGLAARFNVKYEILFTPRLILEPELSANLYSRTDEERGTGSGLSDIGAGLRLRYEITRQVAPYIGVTWNRQFGRTADFTQQRGGDRSEVQAVAGIRLWF